MALAAMFSQARDKKVSTTEASTTPTQPIRKISEAEVKEFKRRFKLNKQGHTGDVTSGR